jgi:hypothetical protein
VADRPTPPARTGQTGSDTGGLPEQRREGSRDPTGVPGLLPAPSEAATVAVEADAAGGTVINYYFPVQIEVIGQLDEAQMKAVADYVFEQLDTELRRHQ